MATTPLPLAQAIANVETAQTQLTNDQATQATAVASVTAAQAKLDAANAVQATANATVTTDITSYDASLDALIASATAAKL